MIEPWLSLPKEAFPANGKLVEWKPGENSSKDSTFTLAAPKPFGFVNRDDYCTVGASIVTVKACEKALGATVIITKARKNG